MKTKTSAARPNAVRPPTAPPAHTYPDDWVRFVHEVDIEGGFESNYKPIKMVAVRVSVQFCLPPEHCSVSFKKLVSVTLTGAAMMGEQMRAAARDAALERSGG